MFFIVPTATDENENFQDGKSRLQFKTECATSYWKQVGNNHSVLVFILLIN